MALHVSCFEFSSPPTLGSALVQEAEARLAAMGCQKISLQVRTSNAAVAEFYKKLGYVIEERISMGKRP
jgi:ribosomal protein S18 acetylase RimI-like enzyme